LQTLSAPFVFTTWLMLGLGWIENHWFDVETAPAPKPIPAAKPHASARPAHGHSGK
jgi:urea transporter